MSRVLITGASGAAGGGVIEAFLAAGWQVVGATHSTPGGEPHDALSWVTMDLADEASAQAGTAEAVKRLGGLDAIVCLAGGFRLTPIDESSWADFAALIDLDYRTTVGAVLAALPHLGEGASIVTIGAKTAQAPGPRSSAYAAAKAGVIAFSRRWRQSCGRAAFGSTASCPVRSTRPPIASRCRTPRRRTG
jgi:NAD(P)-dependent dehydrogenase (short-subunit alcohol dehydrogenase family)